MVSEGDNLSIEIVQFEYQVVMTPASFFFSQDVFGNSGSWHRNLIITYLILK